MCRAGINAASAAASPAIAAAAATSTSAWMGTSVWSARGAGTASEGFACSWASIAIKWREELVMCTGTWAAGGGGGRGGAGIPDCPMDCIEA